MEGLVRTGVDSWSSHWGSEYDVLKILRAEMGEEFPKSYYCAVKLAGTFAESGNERYEWYLISTVGGAETVLSKHAAVKQHSKKSGKDFYQVRKQSIKRGEKRKAEDEADDGYEGAF